MFHIKNKLTISKLDLDHVPFEAFVDTDDEGRELLAKSLAFQNHSSWLLPQLIAKFSTWTPIKSSTVEGKYSPRDTIINAVGNDERLKGMYLVACKLNRSALIKGQTNPANANYCSLVPLILSAYKRFNDIPYSAWDRDELKYIIDKNLLKAVTFFPADHVLDFTTEQLLQFREHGLTIRTGPKAGQTKNILATWTLTGLQGTPLDGFPSLVTTMLSQIWVAHPSVRTNLMILDPINLDNMPSPLIDTDIGISSVIRKKPVTEDLPWN